MVNYYGTEPSWRPRLTPAVDLRRAADRFSTDVGWLDSAHCFSFGPHYDPAQHPLRAAPREQRRRRRSRHRFETHPHRDMEIVTWVLDGGLVHQDSEGHSGVIHPGLAQRMSAGTGILHSEKNDSWRLTGGPEHAEPGPLRADVGRARHPGHRPRATSSSTSPASSTAAASVTVASGMAGHADRRAIRIRNSYAGLHAARLGDGETVTLPDAPFVHLFVAKGAVEPRSRRHPRHRRRRAGSPSATADESPRVGGPAEILVWEMHAQLS